MKKRQKLSLLSLALAGILCGATAAQAYPLLDSDLASSTLLGASQATRSNAGTPGQNAGNGTDGWVLAGVASGPSAVGALTGAQLARGPGSGQPERSFGSTAPGSTGQAPLSDLSAAAPSLPSAGQPLPAAAGPQPATPGPNEGKNVFSGLCDIARARTVDAGLADDALADLCTDDSAAGDGSPGSTRAADSLVRLEPASLGSPGGENEGVDTASDRTGTPDGMTGLAPSSLGPVGDQASLSVPEPSTLLLFGAALAGLGLRRRRPA